jgi:hypothetical protein
MRQPGAVCFMNGSAFEAGAKAFLVPFAVCGQTTFDGAKRSQKEHKQSLIARRKNVENNRTLK